MGSGAFVRTDTPTIMDGLVVRYRRGRQEISASRTRVDIDVSIADEADFAAVIWTIALAWAQHKQLAPNVAALASRVMALPDAMADRAAQAILQDLGFAASMRDFDRLRGPT